MIAIIVALLLISISVSLYSYSSWQKQSEIILANKINDGDSIKLKTQCDGKNQGQFSGDLYLSINDDNNIKFQPEAREGNIEWLIQAVNPREDGSIIDKDYIKLYNKNKEVYLQYDCDNNVVTATDSISKTEKYCKRNCFVLRKIADDGLPIGSGSTIVLEACGGSDHNVSIDVVNNKLGISEKGWFGGAFDNTCVVFMLIKDSEKKV